MEKKTKKGLFKKLIITIMTIVLLSASVVPSTAYASVGGVMRDVIIDFFAFLGDGVMILLQNLMVPESDEGINDLTKADNWVMVPWDDLSSEAKNATGGQAMPQVEEQYMDKTWTGGDDFHFPNIKYSPEEIFKGKVNILAIDYVKPHDVDNNTATKSVAETLHDTIAGWYISLRNLSLAGLMCVLVYIGIRILISSVQDKSKYKQMLKDWLMAIILIFFLHYIMLVTTTIVDIITDAITGDSSVSRSIYVTTDQGRNFGTNMMGYARFMAQYNGNSDSGFIRLSFLVIYLVLIGFTISFTFKYLKRTIMIAFLTMIAPLVTLTYPLDKIGDGKAQAFQTWLNEYIFNVLLQPMHLIIYTVLVGSAMELAKNPLYVIACLFMLKPAEELIKRMFGFDKAKTGGIGKAAAAGAAGAAIGGGLKKGAQALSNGIGAAAGGKGGAGNIRMQNGQNGQAPKLPGGDGQNGGAPKIGKGSDASKAGAAAGAAASADAGAEAKNPALEKYESEGFGQNANGEYFNPWIDEYDPDYNPLEDPEYASLAEGATAGAAAGAVANAGESDHTYGGRGGDPATAEEQANGYDFKTKGGQFLHNMDLNREKRLAKRAQTKALNAEKRANRRLERATAFNNSRFGQKFTAAKGALGEMKNKASENIHNFGEDLSHTRLGQGMAAAGRGMATAGKVVGKGALKGAGTAARIAGKAAGTAAGAAIGAGVGLVGAAAFGDDLDDALMYMGAGAALGGKTGNKVAGNLSTMASNGRKALSDRRAEKINQKSQEKLESGAQETFEQDAQNTSNSKPSPQQEEEAKKQQKAEQKKLEEAQKKEQEQAKKRYEEQLSEEESREQKELEEWLRTASDDDISANPEKSKRFEELNKKELDNLNYYFQNADNNETYTNPDRYQTNLDRANELERRLNGGK